MTPLFTSMIMRPSTSTSAMSTLQKRIPIAAAVRTARPASFSLTSGLTSISAAAPCPRLCFHCSGADSPAAGTFASSSGLSATAARASAAASFGSPDCSREASSAPTLSFPSPCTELRTLRYTSSTDPSRQMQRYSSINGL
eukprot:CAMPEP_0168392162 /NCGR_PEP_ID=MMETSP0228-20121227/18357_1 /TAXON_ID=133427 /ORGANISM="Protoceratium reticulatum, Strain CCCM 535 (=CCMP 1889)" /LENGTH=140 /DNA_ID=CAMNT_0008405497 /DNA_START=178 /DNA_END=600 /DNA_ORIENTATION=-